MQAFSWKLDLLHAISSTAVIQKKAYICVCLVLYLCSLMLTCCSKEKTMKASSLLSIFCLCLSPCIVHCITSKEVIEEVGKVFKLVDGSSFNSDDANTLTLLQPVLQAMSTASCPGTWNNVDKDTFVLCLYALVGRLVMPPQTPKPFAEWGLEDYAQCQFYLDPRTGSIVNGDSAKELMSGGQAISTSNTIMTVLVIILVISMGLILFMQNNASGSLAKQQQEQQQGILPLQPPSSNSK